MTPPRAEGQTRPPEAVSAFPQSGSKPAPAYTILAKRADFLRAASARRQGTGGFLLQARDRQDDNPAIRVGFTCSKKIGNAVARNRAKRRLREVAQLVLPGLARPGWDYVLVGKPGATIARDFATLLDDLRAALDQVHRDRPPKAPK